MPLEPQRSDPNTRIIISLLFHGLGMSAHYFDFYRQVIIVEQPLNRLASIPFVDLVYDHPNYSLYMPNA